ncbi:DUF488 family protein [Glaciibacter superstes]|uniref:DUF488 family protein, N3 subclade n=1 Tax=Glaciibacter superstes TaxID=501023 RepID=UPI0003B56AC2
MTIRIKRVYDDPSADDGFRVLVDRIWPRGITKERANADLWLKEVAPSTELRHWWNHDPEQIDEFTRRYRAELTADAGTNAALSELQDHVGQNERAGANTTLVYSAKDPELNQARVLADYLAGHPLDHPADHPADHPPGSASPAVSAPDTDDQSAPRSPS